MVGIFQLSIVQVCLNVLSINKPTQSQAHWQVAQAITQPKPAKELALPTHSQTENMQQK